MSVSRVRGCVLAYARVVVLVRVRVHAYVKQRSNAIRTTTDTCSFPMTPAGDCIRI